GGAAAGRVGRGGAGAGGAGRVWERGPGGRRAPVVGWGRRGAHRSAWGTPTWPPTPPTLGAPRETRGAPRAPARGRSSRRAERALARRDRDPAVDDQRLARDPAGLVAREIDGAPADVPRGALGAEGIRAPSALPRLGAEVLDHRRPHRTRRDRVDPDA